MIALTIGTEILKLIRQLRFVAHPDPDGEFQAYYYMRCDGKPYKITIRAIDEADYKP